MKLALLCSGGKDSLYAGYLAKKHGEEISCLISLIPENSESFMFHTPNAELTNFQAEAMKVPIIQRKTMGEKEKELGDLKEAVKEAINKYGIEGVVSGAIESIYQSERIQKICRELDLWCFNPLWQADVEEYMKEISKWEIIVVGVFAEGLDEEWLGRRIDNKAVFELIELNKKYGIHVSGEGGEFETFVLNCPLFKKRLNVERVEKIWKRNSGVYKIRKLILKS